MAMALTREQLQTLLESILGSKNVYFQAQNYIRIPRYILTFITRDPLSDIPFKLLNINTAMHVRRYVAEGLYHDVFNIY